ncbi:hypothetical protein [Yoonia sp. 2307UL14-13]|uniref:hypothetical protein n=1 Tax=Yoonia sp. 2307UL14-13 TaxID=3126506 RepID=UPI0030A4CECF
MALNPKPMIKGNHTFTDNESFDGMIGGNATVPANISVTISGMIGGTITVEAGATVTLTGMVGGKLINNGGQIL